MREEFGQNSGENSGKKWREKNKETTEKNSGKFAGREWKVNCIFKSINYLKKFTKTCPILGLGLAQILLTASARIILHNNP